MPTDERARWLSQAEALVPQLHHRQVPASRVVRVTRDADAFQGWRVDAVSPASELPGKPLRRGSEFTLDFGEHLVGHIELSIEVEGMMDAPTRLKLIFGEVPAEVAEPFDPYGGQLGRAWLQDEVVNIDVLPAVIRLPRRYAFRYLKIAVVDTSRAYAIRFTDVRCDAVTSADDARVPPLPAGLPDNVAAIDRVSLRTLANCMQTVFEDGPKRDRRLWLGDLRLQAMTDAVTFRNHDLVKRCLLLFAAMPREDGLANADMYERPTPHKGDCGILDYSALFAPTLLDYARASDDWQTAAELWPVAKKQLDVLRYVNDDGLFIDPGNWWIFIDWQPALHKQAAMHAIIVYCLRQTLELAERVGRQSDVANIRSHVEKMTAAAKQHLWDGRRGLFVSGPERQVSWASQVWMINAGVVEAEEGSKILQRVTEAPDAVRPAGPYLWHSVVEAMFRCRLDERAVELIRSYWGGMVRKGADTFWEVYDPSDDQLSPYGNHLVNSYCHAWSCTPAYFIRTRPRAFMGGRS